MKLIVSALIASLIAPSVGAGDINFVTKSRASFSSPTTDAMGETHFLGKETVSGKYVALWEDPGEGAPPYLVVRLRPDRKSRAILPHEAGRSEVEELWLSNTGKALALLVPKAVRTQLEAKTVAKVEGETRIVITSYTTRVDCDFRGYSATIVSVSQLAKIAAVKGPFGEISC